MAAMISIVCCPCDCCAASAVPWNEPRTAVGRPMSASACLIAAPASARVRPSARLNEIVVASSPSWWLIAVGVARSTKWATALSGTIGVTVLLRALPVEESRAPGLAGTVAGVPLAAAAAAAAVATVGLFEVPVLSPRAGTYRSASAFGPWA